MKKFYYFIFYIMACISVFASYDFPYKNPDIATIFGSSQLMTPGISEKVPVKDYSITLPWSKEVPGEFWYNKGFKYSIVKQNKKAPLIFVLGGTGAAYNSERNKLFQRILYDAGYTVVSISSPMNPNFVINGSSTRVPGIIFDDSKDVYNIMKEIYNSEINGKIETEDIYLIGYSLGATEAAMVSYIDEEEKVFNFKRVFMVNPAVNAYKSATKIDNFLGYPVLDRPKKVAELVEKSLSKLTKNANPPYTTISPEYLYKVVTSDMTTKEREELIGMVFRLTAVDLNYITDSLNKMGVYSKGTVGKFSSMFEVYGKLNFASFEDYIQNIAFPYYKKQDPNLTFEQLLEKSNLSCIENYLVNAKKIAVVTNEDELILDKEDIDYLKKVFKDRIIVYPYGGHCGNMYYYQNVSNMLKFLKEGVINEKI